MHEQINSALRNRDPAWAFFRTLNKEQRDYMDRALVRINHPTASEPGTQWDRFRRLHNDGFQFTYLD